MDKIVISNLNNNDLNTLFYELTPEEMESISGGVLGDPLSNVYITTFHGDLNSPSSSNYGPGAVNDNKINTIDYARSTYIWVVN